MSFTPVKIGTLEYFTADNITVPHCFTTRLGGVSTGKFDSLNLSISQGDDPACVTENYRRIGAALGVTPEDIINARQTHSDIVLPVGEAHRGTVTGKTTGPFCDGMITNTPGIGLFVSTADCTPILLQDPVTGAVGAVHAGWRGTAAAIAAKAVEAMVKHYGCYPKNIRAAIGPNASVCHFETDADVPEAMVSAFGPEVIPFIHPKGQKYYVNLKEINALILRRCGVQDIAISQHCTMCRPDLFWSHRITRGQRGAQGAIIVCKEVLP